MQQSKLGWRRGGYTALVLLLLVVGGCGGADSGAPAAEQELIVFAAASLTDAFNALGEAFMVQQPGVVVRLNFASSSQLAVQLLEGARADVFASANERQMAVVVENGRIADQPLTFASNRLAIAVPTDNPGNVTELAELARPGLLLVLAVPGVPVRDYADAILTMLASDPDYGADFRRAVYANVVSEEDNVRQVVAKIALGEADAGIVYVTDVTPDLAGSVTLVPIPNAQNVIAAYPLGLLTDAPHPQLAQQFMDFVRSDAGQAILAEWGFGPPATP